MGVMDLALTLKVKYFLEMFFYPLLLAAHVCSESQLSNLLNVQMYCQILCHSFVVVVRKNLINETKLHFVAAPDTNTFF